MWVLNFLELVFTEKFSLFSDGRLFLKKGYTFDNRQIFKFPISFNLLKPSLSNSSLKAESRKLISNNGAFVAVLDALSNDTNRAQNDRLCVEIWSIYWENTELETSRKRLVVTALLYIFGNFASTLTEMFLHEKMPLFMLCKIDESSF